MLLFCTRQLMHTLLEHAADVTLCNQSNQTAMHVCPPELREELLLAMPRPLLPPQAQLLQACWQGNLQLLQHWLVGDNTHTHTDTLLSGLLCLFPPAWHY